MKDECGGNHYLRKGVLSLLDYFISLSTKQ